MINCKRYPNHVISFLCQTIWRHRWKFKFVDGCDRQTTQSLVSPHFSFWCQFCMHSTMVMVQWFLVRHRTQASNRTHGLWSRRELIVYFPHSLHYLKAISHTFILCVVVVAGGRFELSERNSGWLLYLSYTGCHSLYRHTGWFQRPCCGLSTGPKPLCITGSLPYTHFVLRVDRSVLLSISEPYVWDFINQLSMHTKGVKLGNSN